jgi:hypothetical protein
MRERNNILAESMLGWTREEVDNNTEEQRIQYEFVNGCDTRRVSFAIDLIKPMHRIKKHSL